MYYMYYSGVVCAYTCAGEAGEHGAGGGAGGAGAAGGDALSWLIVYSEKMIIIIFLKK